MKTTLFVLIYLGLFVAATMVVSVFDIRRPITAETYKKELLRFSTLCFFIIIAIAVIIIKHKQ